MVFDEIEGGLVTRSHVLPCAGRRRVRAASGAASSTAPPAGLWACAAPPHRRSRPPYVRRGGTGPRLGGQHVVIPRSGPMTAEQRAREHERDWKRRYRWRAGIEGRIQRLRRDYGLARVHSHGAEGLERDIGATLAGASSPANCAISPPRRPSSMPTGDSRLPSVAVPRFTAGQLRCAIPSACHNAKIFPAQGSHFAPLARTSSQYICPISQFIWHLTLSRPDTNTATSRSQPRWNDGFLSWRLYVRNFSHWHPALV